MSTFIQAHTHTHTYISELSETTSWTFRSSLTFKRRSETIQQTVFKPAALIHLKCVKAISFKASCFTALLCYFTDGRPVEAVVISQRIIWPPLILVWWNGVSLSKKRFNDGLLEVIIARLPSSSRQESGRIYINVFACVKMSEDNHRPSGIMMKCLCLNWNFTLSMACRLYF